MAERFRTFWKGYLRLSLVTIPVRLVTATRSDTAVHFHQIDKKSRQRIRYKKVAEGGGAVDKDDIVYGYEVEPGNYVLLEPDEIDAVKIETRHTIELTQFVEACEIDPLYFEKPYYLLPDGEVAEEGYRVIHDALKSSRKVGIGQLTLRGKENLVALHPSGAGLLLETLRYEEEIKAADEVFADIGHGSLRGDLVEMARDLIARKAAPFDADLFKNHYAAALRQLVDEKIKTGHAVAVGENETERPGTVIDFMEALKRSVAQAGRAGGDRGPPKTAPAEEQKSGVAAAPKARRATKAEKAPEPVAGGRARSTRAAKPKAEKGDAAAKPRPRKAG